MSSDARIAAHLARMIDSASSARHFVQDTTLDEYLQDDMKQSACTLKLLLIGEEATKLLRDHKSFTDSNPNIPWQSMVGMRNRIAHGYFEIDHQVVWTTIVNWLPDLLSQLMPITFPSSPHSSPR
jgi:uncharacterized protein with HEPN domain